MHETYVSPNPIFGEEVYSVYSLNENKIYEEVKNE